MKNKNQQHKLSNDNSKPDFTVDKYVTVSDLENTQILILAL